MPHELRPPREVLERFPRSHPLHQRFLALPPDHPQRIAYDEVFSEEGESAEEPPE